MKSKLFEVFESSDKYNGIKILCEMIILFIGLQ